MRKVIICACVLAVGLFVFLRDTASKPHFQQATWQTSLLGDPVYTLRDESNEDYGRVKSFPYHKVIDLDGDGTKEVFLATAAGDFLAEDDYALMLGFADGGARVIAKFENESGCQVYIDRPTSTLTFYTRGAGETASTVYKLKKGKLKPVTTFESYQRYHDPHHNYDNEDTQYYQDADACTEKTFKLLSNAYLAEKNVISFKK